MALLLVIPVTAAPAPAEPARIVAMRHTSAARQTRIDITLSRHVAFSRFELAAGAGQPRRLVLDLRGASRRRPMSQRVGDARVSRIRIAQRDADTARVVVDLCDRSRRGRATVKSIRSGPRSLHVVIADSDSQGAARLHGAYRASMGRLRVVIDAGHGGRDAGAMGPTRVTEKRVTLAIARRIARQLRGRGYAVILTRRRDRFVSLAQRAALANARRADAFVSIHANATRGRGRRGLETFVRRAPRSRPGSGPHPQRRGAQLARARSVGASYRLAELVQRSVREAIRGRVGRVRDRGVKSAGFQVLTDTHMPAVLVETGFITTRSEERRLTSARYQEAVAAGVAKAIAAFDQDQRAVAAR